MSSNSQSGITLVGVLISGIVVAVVTTGLAQTIVLNRAVTKRATQNFIATNLAQAGLEYVRANRDNQWLKNPSIVGLSEQLCSNIPQSPLTNYSRTVSCKAESDSKLIVEAQVAWGEEKPVIVKEELYDWFPR